MNRLLPIVALVACHHPTPATKTASCADVATHVQTLLAPKPDPKPDAKPDDRGKRVHDIFATRCATDKWPQAALVCMANTASLHDGHHCKDQLSLDQRRTLDADLDAFDREASAARIPAACAEYKKLVDRLMRCDKMPQASRDAMKQGYDAMAISMEGTAGEQRLAMEQGCKYATDAVRSTLANWGCDK